jgi:hypothetical protein
MRGLAEFIMRGRWQALAVAVLGAGSLLFGWVSAAAIALVTLRKGLEDGGWLVLWALLPAVLAAWISGDSGSILLLLGTFLLAGVLRYSVSLSLAMIASVAVGAASGLSLLAFSDAFLAEVVAVFSEVLTQLEASIPVEEGAQVVLSRPTALQVAGILAVGNAAVAVLSLLLGRWWQSLLYNPGGFALEFQALRLSRTWLLLLLAAALLLWSAGPEWVGWSAIAVVPLTAWGFALVHARAKLRGRGKGWLTGIYVLWLLIDPAKLMLIGLVIADAWIDFRSRWQHSADNGAA